MSLINPQTCTIEDCIRPCTASRRINNMYSIVHCLEDSNTKTIFCKERGYEKCLHRINRVALCIISYDQESEFTVVPEEEECFTLEEAYWLIALDTFPSKTIVPYGNTPQGVCKDGPGSVENKSLKELQLKGYVSLHPFCIRRTSLSPNFSEDLGKLFFEDIKPECIVHQVLDYLHLCFQGESIQITKRSTYNHVSGSLWKVESQNSEYHALYIINEGRENKAWHLFNQTSIEHTSCCWPIEYVFWETNDQQVQCWNTNDLKEKDPFAQNLTLRAILFKEDQDDWYPLEDYYNDLCSYDTPAKRYTYIKGAGFTKALLSFARLVFSLDQAGIDHYNLNPHTLFISKSNPRKLAIFDFSRCELVGNTSRSEEDKCLIVASDRSASTDFKKNGCPEYQRPEILLSILGIQPIPCKPPEEESLMNKSEEFFKIVDIDPMRKSDCFFLKETRITKDLSHSCRSQTVIFLQRTYGIKEPKDTNIKDLPVLSSSAFAFLSMSVKGILGHSIYHYYRNTSNQQPGNAALELHQILHERMTTTRYSEPDIILDELTSGKDDLPDDLYNTLKIVIDTIGNSNENPEKALEAVEDSENSTSSHIRDGASLCSTASLLENHKKEDCCDCSIF